MKLTKNLYHKLSDLCTPGVYAFINENRKKVYLTHTTNILESIGRNLKLLNGDLHPCKKLQKDTHKITVVVLETFGYLTKRDTLLRYEYWMNYYKQLDYQFYRDYKAIQYKVRIDVVVDLVHVCLVNSRNDRLVVGVFDKMTKAEEFIHSTYTPMKQIVPVYATNPLSKEYFDRNKEDFS